MGRWRRSSPLRCLISRASRRAAAAGFPAHGPRHMPVWGYEFFGDEPDDEAAHAEASVKIERLVSYLRSIQRGE
jgi:hypothetical protein